MIIVIRNLPQHTTEAEVWEIVEPYGQVTNVELFTEGNPDDVLAAVNTDLSRAAANAISSRIGQRFIGDHQLYAWVPLHQA